MTRAGVLVLALLPLAALAADPPRHSFGCDTPGGNYSDWTRTVSSPHIEITGKVQIATLREHKKWKPTAAIFLRGGKGTAPFGIRFGADDHKAKELSVELFKIGGRDTIGSIRKADAWVPFTLTLTPDGMLSATVGDAKGTVRVGDFRPDKLEFSCSTSSVNFADVTVAEKD